MLGDFGGVFLLEAKHTCVRFCVTEKGVGLCCRQQEELHKDEEPAGHSDRPQQAVSPSFQLNRVFCLDSRCCVPLCLFHTRLLLERDLCVRCVLGGGGGGGGGGVRGEDGGRRGSRVWGEGSGRRGMGGGEWEERMGGGGGR